MSDGNQPDYESLMSLGHYLVIDGIPVETRTEPTGIEEITEYLTKDQTRSFYFTNVNTANSNLVGNIWSTRKAIAASFNCNIDDIPGILSEALEKPVPYVESTKPKVMENTISKPNLKDVPIPLFFPNDGGPYVTAGIVIVKDKEGNVNASFHRLQVIGNNRFAIRIVPRHLNKIYNETEGDLKVAVVIGLTPATLLPAAMSVAYGINELEIASSICKQCYGRPLEVKTLESGIPVPASAEYVMEGRLLKEQTDEGPFVDITGTYDKIRKQPILEIDAIHHRNNPIFHAILPGGFEHYLMMGMPREPIIKSSVESVAPKVYNVRLTEGGCCWLHGVVSIKKVKEGDGKNAIMAAFTGHPSMKRVIIVDEDIDIYDDTQVEWALATRFQGHKDLVLIEGASGSSLDPTRSGKGLTSKVGFDATKPLKGGDEFERVI